jgi:hypothetical protein
MNKHLDHDIYHPYVCHFKFIKIGGDLIPSNPPLTK